jgi:predicted transglutaminase-like cysteine proteinase
MNLARHATTAALAALIAVFLLASTGCVNALATAMYVIRGNNIEAEFNDFKNKKVVVVCRATADLGFSSAAATRDLARQVGQLLAANVRKIQVVPARDVENWADENSWDDPREVGEALGAQMVLEIDLEHFALYKGQTLYQGSADYTLRVIDLEQGGETVWQKSPPRSLWPPNSAVLTSEKREPEFRQEYVAILASEIAKHFYAHDAYAQFAADAQVQ